MNREEQLLNRVKEELQKGQMEQARSLAGERDTKSTKDAALHLSWADLLEELGLFDEVIVVLNLAIRDKPDDTHIYRRLSELYLDNGNSDRAARCWWMLVKREPANATYYKELGRIFEEAGDYEKAMKVYRAGQEKTGGIWQAITGNKLKTLT